MKKEITLKLETEGDVKVIGGFDTTSRYLLVVNPRGVPQASLEHAIKELRRLGVNLAAIAEVIPNSIRVIDLKENL